MNDLPYLIIGGGGHAAVLADILLSQSAVVAGVVAPTIDSKRAIFTQLEHFSRDDDVLAFAPQEVLLVNGIGSMPFQQLRTAIYRRFKKEAYTFASVIANSSTVSPYAKIEEGAQILTNAVVGVGTKIGSNTIVNTSASIDHDCEIGSHCHIAPGSTLSGHVIVENDVHIATGVSVMNNLTIGAGAVIGLGANVVRNVEKNTTVYGTIGQTKEASDD